MVYEPQAEQLIQTGILAKQSLGHPLSSVKFNDLIKALKKCGCDFL
jgi:hypothetical protein